ncbi:MAG: hypothetical protein HXY46_01265 [Syntrophaceae bacterium]|nr:hypothetical protein [Syntrophaceae bacterium]
MKDQVSQVFLRTNLVSGHLRLVTSFAEESAKVFNLGVAEALKMALACEEIFTYLCQAGRTDEMITIEAINGGYYAELRLLFKATNFNPRAFNLTASVSAETLDNKLDLREMGLLIASRIVDRFFITGSLQQDLELILVKEKSYPDLTELEVPKISQIKKFSFRTPDPESLKLFVRLVRAHCPSHLYLPAFNFPGKIVDMVASNEYGAGVAVGDHGEIGGGIVWHWIGNRLVEFFGPYQFGQPGNPELAMGLVDFCLGRIAKTDAISLISRYPVSELPQGYFESLGSIDFIQPDGSSKPRPIYYRQLQEDLGCPVWAHPLLEEFLRREYRRLFFAREIRLTRHEGEKRPPGSVFAPQFDRTKGEITLKPIWDGEDVSANLAQHIKVLKAENLPNIFFEIDLAHPWQANLTPSLFENNFRPQLILPYGGEADVVVFQHQEGR